MNGLFHQLFDDAAIFPPGSASPCAAVRGHLSHLASPYANVVGPLVVSDARWDEVGAVLPVGATIDVALVVTAGPAGVGPAVERALADPSARLRAVEVAPAGGGAEPATRDPDALVAEALRGVRTVEVPGVVEVPLGPHAPRAIEALAGTGATAKLRTGGLTAEAHPDELVLATALVAAVRAGTPLKFTAGLHHATRTTEPSTGAEQHGLLNIALAMDAALTGAEPSEVALTLAERNRGRLAAAINALGDQRVATLRRLWRWVGTCSIIDPVGELADLGVLEAAQLVGAGAPRGGS